MKKSTTTKLHMNQELAKIWWNEINKRSENVGWIFFLFEIITWEISSNAWNNQTNPLLWMCTMHVIILFRFNSHFKHFFPFYLSCRSQLLKSQYILFVLTINFSVDVRCTVYVYYDMRYTECWTLSVGRVDRTIRIISFQFNLYFVSWSACHCICCRCIDVWTVFVETFNFSLIESNHNGRFVVDISFRRCLRICIFSIFHN